MPGIGIEKITFLSPNIVEFGSNLGVFRGLKRSIPGQIGKKTNLAKSPDITEQLYKRSKNKAILGDFGRF